MYYTATFKSGAQQILELGRGDYKDLVDKWDKYRAYMMAGGVGRAPGVPPDRVFAGEVGAVIDLEDLSCIYEYVPSKLAEKFVESL